MGGPRSERTVGDRIAMNFLVLGDGPDELAWAHMLADHPDHRLWAAYPGFKAFPDLPGGSDLDEALATAGVEAVVAGGAPDLRSEGLRRAAAAGLPVLCLHPPGADADAYYQVALSHQETGAIVVPDLPARLHPGLETLRQAIASQELGAYRGLRFEMPVGPADGSLLGVVFPRVIDAVRALLGEVDALTASGDPPGEDPADSLLVILRGPDARRGEARLWTGPHEPARLSLAGDRGSLTLEFDPTFCGAARLVRRLPASRESETTTELEPWDPRAAILQTLTEAVAGHQVHPDLLDGTRTMEIAQAAAQSLRRGRTIDLHYEEVSEASNFKSVMISMGCLLLFAAMIALPAALIGPSVGFPWTIYIAYAIPPVLIGFMLLQGLKLAMKKESS